MTRLYGMHVVPYEEMFQHDVRTPCVCEPRLDVGEDETGQLGWVYVHHAIDSQEKTDQ